MKLELRLILFLSVILFITGCAPQPKAISNNVKPGKTTLEIIHADSKADQIDPKHLNQKQIASAVAVYVNQRFPGMWPNIVKRGLNQGLTLTPTIGTEYKYNNSPNKAVYLFGNKNGYAIGMFDGQKSFNLYHHGHLFAVVPEERLIRYLNHRDAKKVVNNIAKNLTITDEVEVE